jgi:hypothetical protein
MVKVGVRYPKYKRKSLKRIDDLIKHKKKVADYRSSNKKKFNNPMNDTPEVYKKYRRRRR